LSLTQINYIHSDSLLITLLHAIRICIPPVITMSHFLMSFTCSIKVSNQYCYSNIFIDSVIFPCSKFLIIKISFMLHILCISSYIICRLH
jgi:hypothetical protein